MVLLRGMGWDYVATGYSFSLSNFVKYWCCKAKEESVDFQLNLLTDSKHYSLNFYV